jgi:hypothetical protein
VQLGLAGKHSAGDQKRAEERPGSSWATETRDALSLGAIGSGWVAVVVERWAAVVAIVAKQRMMVANDVTYDHR